MSRKYSLGIKLDSAEVFIIRRALEEYHKMIYYNEYYSEGITNILKRIKDLEARYNKQ